MKSQTSNPTAPSGSGAPTTYKSIVPLRVTLSETPKNKWSGERMLWSEKTHHVQQGEPLPRAEN